MKYLSEYRDAGLVQRCLEKIRKTVTRPWNIMEICGGQTHGLVKTGILEMLPEDVRMIHGPGCPVCVTPIHIIDEAIELAGQEGVILCSFGDMLRVPGSGRSLLDAKAKGGDVRPVYSPLEAVKLAAANPDKEVVFLAVGFETTAPANALSVLQAASLQLTNFTILTSHVLVPPAIKAIMDDPEHTIDGFLAAGHVCTIMGMKEYAPIASRYRVPIVVTGFEPLDLVQGIWMVIQQLEEGRHDVENQYTRIVSETGNVRAQDTINAVFRVADREWRGIGSIPQSGLELRDDFSTFDARKKFGLQKTTSKEHPDCLAGQVLKGIIKPAACPSFGKSCTPQNPLGAPMVSSEGACAAYFHYAMLGQQTE